MTRNYRRLGDHALLRDDNVSVPVDPLNADYREYLGWVAQGNQPTPADVPSLDEIKRAAKAEVDRRAEMARTQYITPGAGQAMSYREKLNEALDCLVRFALDNPPPVGTYPLLESEVGITAGSTLAVAQAVSSTYNSWKLIEANINGIRLAAKQNIDAALNAAAVQAVRDAVVYPAP